MSNVNVFVLAITKTKIDQPFLLSQVLLNGFHNPCRLDFSSKSGNNLIYVGSCFASRQFRSLLVPSDIQAIPFEIDLRKEFFFLCTDQPSSQNNQYFLDCISTLLTITTIFMIVILSWAVLI